MHIHLLNDAVRLDLSFKCIAQSFKFIGRFTNQQRQLRQKCQLVPSTHLSRSSSELIRGLGSWLVGRTPVPRITRRVSTDLRSEPLRTQPTPSLHVIQTMGRPGPTSADPR